MAVVNFKKPMISLVLLNRPMTKQLMGVFLFIIRYNFTLFLRNLIDLSCTFIFRVISDREFPTFLGFGSLHYTLLIDIFVTRIFKVECHFFLLEEALSHIWKDKMLVFTFNKMKFGDFLHVYF